MGRTHAMTETDSTSPQSNASHGVEVQRRVRRWDGPNHTADQQCAVCRCWGADNYVNKGNAGITQMLWLCDVCNTPNATLSHEEGGKEQR